MRTIPILTAALLASPLAAQEVTFERGNRNTDFQPAFDAQFRAPLKNSGVQFQKETVVGGLVHPWGIEVLPDGAGLLVTERAGNLRHVSADGTLSDPIKGLPDVLAQVFVGDGQRWGLGRLKNSSQS